MFSSKTPADLSTPRRRPRIISHRGAWHEAPENTLPAFARALELGAEGIEFDVQLTSDNVAVVLHDEKLDRITGFHGHLHRTPFETVRSLDAAARFKDAAFAGTRIPTLAEVLELLAPHDILINIEIKTQEELVADAAEQIGGIIAGARMRGPVLVSSFHEGLLHELGRRHPALPRALILNLDWLVSLHQVLDFARDEHLAALHPSVHMLTTESVALLKREGYAVNAWTVNDRRHLDHCVALGLDGIITDDVAFAKGYLDSLFAPKERL